MYRQMIERKGRHMCLHTYVCMSTCQLMISSLKMILHLKNKKANEEIRK